MQTATTFGLVFLGPVLAVATFLALGPFSQGSNSPALRLILLSDVVYILVVATLVLARLARLVSDRRSQSAGSRLHLRLSGVFALVALVPTVLVAVFAVLTGMVGALSAKALFGLLRIDDWTVRGFALGTTSHGIGAARAMQVHPDAGAYAGLAMALQVLTAAVWMPWLARWWGN